MTEIKQDKNDVIVIHDKKEVFKKPKTKQAVSIASDIYMYYKYGGNNSEKRLQQCRIPTNSKIY
jgi:hypothetical protein